MTPVSDPSGTNHQDDPPNPKYPELDSEAFVPEVRKGVNADIPVGNNIYVWWCVQQVYISKCPSLFLCFSGIQYFLCNLHLCGAGGGNASPLFS